MRVVASRVDWREGSSCWFLLLFVPIGGPWLLSDPSRVCLSERWKRRERGSPRRKGKQARPRAELCCRSEVSPILWRRVRGGCSYFFRPRLGFSAGSSGTCFQLAAVVA